MLNSLSSVSIESFTYRETKIAQNTFSMYDIFVISLLGMQYVPLQSMENNVTYTTRVQHYLTNALSNLQRTLRG